MQKSWGLLEGGAWLYSLEGTHDWDIRGRLQATVERPLGKQLGTLSCWDRPYKSSSCGKGSSTGFLDDSSCLSLCCGPHIPEREGHSHLAQVLSYGLKPSLLDSAETTKSYLYWCRLLGKAAGLGWAPTELSSHSLRASCDCQLFLFHVCLSQEVWSSETCFDIWNRHLGQ